MRQSKKVFIGLALALLLAVATAAPATAEVEESVVAMVTVNTFISFTVQDSGSPGLAFGALHPGSSDRAELAQNGRGAVTLSLGVETNIGTVCAVSTRAADFVSGSNIMPISNAKWDTDHGVSGARPMTKTYAQITALSPGGAQDVWHWLSVPRDQRPGTYTTGFYYQATGVTS